MPGVCGAVTIYGSHGKVRSHPNQIGRINGNPIRDEIEEVSRMARLDFIIDTILNEDDEICLSLRYLLDVRKITIGMVTTGISKEAVAAMGLKPYTQMEEAIADGLRRHGRNARIGILPKAPMTLLEAP